MTRSYTVKELDDLRSVVRDRLLFGTSSNKGGGRTSRPYYGERLIQEVEEAVRTHMMAGHTAQDILDEDRNKELTRWPERQ